MPQRWLAMKTVVLFPILLGLHAVANSQVYKCVKDGTTVFSGIPCSTDAEKVRSAPALSVETTGKPRWGDACVAELHKWVQFKDPGSVQVGKIEDAGSSATATGVFKTFVLHVNGRNSFGAMAGEKPYLCQTSIDGYRVIGIF